MQSIGSRVFTSTKTIYRNNVCKQKIFISSIHSVLNYPWFVLTNGSDHGMGSLKERANRSYSQYFFLKKNLYGILFEKNVFFPPTKIKN